MNYNVKLTVYDNDIQVSRYQYQINRMTEEERKINEINKQRTMVNKQHIEHSKKPTKDSDKSNKIRSERRSKQSIYELARANTWEWFATFTFENDRYKYDLVSSRLKKWLNNFKARYVADLEYLVVPEQHKDGAWHFHALLIGRLDDSITPTWRGGRYTIPQFKYGLMEVERVKDTNRVSSYITKYITKELANVMQNKRRYFYSKGLKKPQHIHMTVSKDTSTVDFVVNNFESYYVTHSKVTEWLDNKIEYVQLRSDKDDEYNTGDSCCYGNDNIDIRDGVNS